MSAGLEHRAALRGFTLIELIVVMALIAIMLSLAAPSFVRFQRSSELTSAANSLIAAMTTARSEAMKRNRSAYVKPTSGNDWTSGWSVYVDVNGNGISVGDEVVITEPAIARSISTPTTVNQFNDGTDSYVLFNGSGFPRLSNGSFSTSSSLEFMVDATLRRRILMNASGRMRVCNPLTDTGC